jgi:hypothetical protein
MAITTREYNLTDAKPINIIKSLEQALSDLNWMDGISLGYLTTFTNTPGSVVELESNKRYLVTQSQTNGVGNTATFDVLRNQFGGVQTVTLVHGGSFYNLIGLSSISASTTVISGLTTTSGLTSGMVVTKVSGTGTIPLDTVINSVDSATQITINRAPTLALSNAALQFADTITLSAASISGSTYTRTVTGTTGQSILQISNNTDIKIGQRVIGSGLSPLAVITAMSGNTIILNFANTDNINGSVTFSDEILITTTGVANFQNILGTASGLTITNLATNANIYVGARLVLKTGSNISLLDSGSNFYDGSPIVTAITGTGPFTITFNNIYGNHPGFVGVGAITFDCLQGSSSEYFDKDIQGAPLTSAWSIAKITNANNKKLGTTFWNFYATLSTALHMPTGGVAVSLYVRGMTGFNPSTNSAQGVNSLDWFNTPSPVQTIPFSIGITIASNTQVPLKLRVRQSEIDPNFASFSFFEEGTNNNRNPFFISKYNTGYQPWDLNDVFLGGVYEMFNIQSYNTLDVGINFRTKFSGIPKRMAESGYGNYFQTNTSSFIYTNTAFRTMSGNRQSTSPGIVYDGVAFYTRNEGDIQSNVKTISVFKNVPINPYYAPVPYYLPNDFVIAEIPYGNANVGDTITISNSEIYTLIQTSVNAITYTCLAVGVRTT